MHASPPSATETRICIVVMGVSGCGKSTIAAALAAALGLSYVDADDLHLAQSIAKMRAGISLDDDDRWPWLDRVADRLNDTRGSPAGVALACSALRRVYRDRIRRHAPGVQFVFLDGTRDEIRHRLASRTGHYMPESLLDSQVQTLEPPDASEPDVVRLHIGASVATLLARAVEAMGSRP